MDKLTTISATLFMAADVFAIVSLAMPDWIVTEEAGKLDKMRIDQSTGTGQWPPAEFSLGKQTIVSNKYVLLE